MFSLPGIDRIEDGAVQALFRAVSAQFKAWALKEHTALGEHAITVPDGTLEVGDYIWASHPNGRAKSLLANGQAVSRVTYKSYFEKVGTTYGAGDGATTFNIPDVRGRFILGVAASGTGAVLGETGGDIDHTHTAGSHTHSISSDGGGTTSSDGDHSHSVTGTTGTASTTFTGDPPFGVPIIASDHVHDVTGSTNSTGAHSHTFGGHNHGGSTGSATGGSTDAANPPYISAYAYVYVGVD